MLTLIESQSQIRRMRGLTGYPDPEYKPEAEGELIKVGKRARSLDSLQEIVDRIVAQSSTAPKPAELLALILGPATPKYTPPAATRCKKCGDSGWEPRWVLRTARAGGAGFQVQSLAEEEYNDLAAKVKPPQAVYSSVRRCACPVPSDPTLDPQEVA